jgi:hypothetical protein
MSDKISVSFDFNSIKDLDLFGCEIKKRFEYSCKQTARYNACSTDSETALYRKYRTQANAYSELYLACIRGLLDGGKKDA